MTTYTGSTILSDPMIEVILLIYFNSNPRPVDRGRGKVFPGPATFGGPAVAQKYCKWCFQVASF